MATRAVEKFENKPFLAKTEYGAFYAGKYYSGITSVPRTLCTPYSYYSITYPVFFVRRILSSLSLI